jgi:hypothetical protein
LSTTAQADSSAVTDNLKRIHPRRIIAHYHRLFVPTSAARPNVTNSDSDVLRGMRVSATSGSLRADLGGKNLARGMIE